MQCIRWKTGANAKTDRTDGFPGILSLWLKETGVCSGPRTERKPQTERLALLLAALNRRCGYTYSECARQDQLATAAVAIRGDTDEPLTGISYDLHPHNWQMLRPDGIPFKPEDLPLSQAVLHGLVSRNVDAIIRNSSGEDRWILANAAPVRNETGEITAGVLVFPDITELKKAEGELRQSEHIVSWKL
jgi:PAS domain-containing protein